MIKGFILSILGSPPGGVSSESSETKMVDLRQGISADESISVFLRSYKP